MQPQSITALFCAIGNPLNDGTRTYTWENGRQLKQMQSVDTTAAFVYNENGLRVQKTVNGVVTKYTLHGKNIHHMTQGDNELHFFYDAQNKPAVVVYNGTPYSYVKNLQGDIVAILDSNGAVVVSYVYDAWGRPISKTGTLASTLGTVQPFRYRGYVYDEETGLYYLRNRFYNRNVGRFLNSDSIITGDNYNYCRNMPVSNMDQDGLEPTIARKLPLQVSRFSFFTEGVRPEIALALMVDLPQCRASTSYRQAHPGYQLLEITAAATAEPEIGFRSSTGRHNVLAALAYNAVDSASIVGGTIGDGVSIFYGPGAGDLVKAGLAIAGELLPSKPIIYEYEIYSLTYEYHDSVPGFREFTIVQTFAKCEDSLCSEHTHVVNVEVFYKPEYGFDYYGAKGSFDYYCPAD